MIGLVFLCWLCTVESDISLPPTDTPYLIVLGTSQDGGYPQAGCTKECCKDAWQNPELKRMTACIAIVDPIDNKQWIIDATPDFREQLHTLGNATGMYKGQSLSGIILTHAHAGHYTGLIHLGREVMGTKDIPVFTMPGMKKFLSENGPWNQLVKLSNIELKTMRSDSSIQLNERISITPLLVPHRDEYTETVGIIIESSKKRVLYLPDIDKWTDWNLDINAIISQVDVAFLDGTFFKNGEIPGKDMSDVPHPFIEESFRQFKNMPEEDKSKIHFIHFNHTNPVLKNGSEAQKVVYRKGFKIAVDGQIVPI